MLLMAALFVLNEPPPAQLVQREQVVQPAAPRSAFDAAVHTLATNVLAPLQRHTAASPAPVPTVAPGSPAPAAAPAVATPAEAAPPPEITVAQAAPLPAPAPVAAPAAAVQPPAPAAALPAPVPAAQVATGPTIADAHPLLARVLQQIETGRGDEVIALLDRPARGSGDAQAFARAFDDMVKGVRPRVVNVQFNGEPRNGRLLVRGTIKLRVDDVARDLVLEAEFVQRDGGMLMTRLALGGP